MKLHTTVLSLGLAICGLTSSTILAADPAAPAAPAAQAAAPALDYGDFSSSTLTTKAWDAMGAGNLDAAIAYTDKCIEMYLTEAKAQQATLTAPAPKESAFDYWALNDVGTSLFIAGEAKVKKGDIPGATEAYKTLVNDLKYAQCWDTKGWFWAPADAAQGKLKALEFGALNAAE